MFTSYECETGPDLDCASSPDKIAELWTLLEESEGELSEVRDELAELRLRVSEAVCRLNDVWEEFEAGRSSFSPTEEGAFLFDSIQAEIVDLKVLLDIESDIE